MNESQTTQELIESCATYLHDRFDYTTRMAEVTEQLSSNPDALDSALADYMDGNGLMLRITLENAAKSICESSAIRLIKAHGDKWQCFYEEVSYE